MRIRNSSLICWRARSTSITPATTTLRMRPKSRASSSVTSTPSRPAPASMADNPSRADAVERRRRCGGRDRRLNRAIRPRIVGNANLGRRLLDGRRRRRRGRRDAGAGRWSGDPPGHRIERFGGRVGRVRERIVVGRRECRIGTGGHRTLERAVVRGQRVVVGRNQRDRGARRPLHRRRRQHRRRPVVPRQRRLRIEVAGGRPLALRHPDSVATEQLERIDFAVPSGVVGFEHRGRRPPIERERPERVVRLERAAVQRTRRVDPGRAGDGDANLVRFDQQTIARTQYPRPAAHQPLFGLVDIDAVGARVLEVEHALGEADDGVPVRHLGMRQHPVAAARPTDRPTIRSERLPPRRTEGRWMR